ncbi:syrP protein [Ktedonobacter sp. SOSP1-52]|uniref:TauD/TfdA family dioxygenase n=1 Tax=Ktedonobacter sp. SOSP1-52 TaxID=2778366 RepID=UPI0019156BED|nr:TauD/TfdA family dioxygenase [Ktedonobacter sp. SOSP1-52]GHO70207.1 syrP protein [Ktedonobacter sp. SOSP1-52]
MEKKPSLKASIRRNIQERREEINLGSLKLTQEGYLEPGLSFPLVVRPAMDGVNLVAWTENNKEHLNSELAKHGAILFRDFPLGSAAKFEAFATAASVSGELFNEYGDLPRDDPGLKIYHSTPYPADKTILFHNESSHMHRWPLKQWFYCVTVAGGKGATPIIDCRQTYKALDPALVRRFAEKKLLYVRNFIDGLDVSWQQFFQTKNKERVEEYCRNASIDFEWKSERHLRTRQVCPAVVKHPLTGEMSFFNQIQLHHISCLDPEVRESMLSMFSEEDLPRNVYYGDGTPIEDSTVAEISELYEKMAVRFQWQANDILMLDNMMIAHARDPFEGNRKILVAMADIMYQKDFI